MEGSKAGRRPRGVVGARMPLAMTTTTSAAAAPYSAATLASRKRARPPDPDGARRKRTRVDLPFDSMEPVEKRAYEQKLRRLERQGSPPERPLTRRRSSGNGGSSDRLAGDAAAPAKHTARRSLSGDRFPSGDGPRPPKRTAHRSVSGGSAGSRERLTPSPSAVGLARRRAESRVNDPVEDPEEESDRSPPSSPQSPVIMPRTGPGRRPLAMAPQPAAPSTPRPAAAPAASVSPVSPPLLPVLGPTECQLARTLCLRFPASPRTVRVAQGPGDALVLVVGYGQHIAVWERASPAAAWTERHCFDVGAHWTCFDLHLASSVLLVAFATTDLPSARHFRC